MKQIYARLLPIIIVLLSAGCTYDLWTQTPLEDTYLESVEAILISGDGQTLAVVSPRYHYLFKVETALKQALAADFRPQLIASFSDFRVTPGQEISGRLLLSLPATVAATELSAAEAIGFVVTSPEGSRQLVINLEGERHEAGKTSLPTVTRKSLNRRYQVRVVAETGLSTVEKIKSTPIALLGDALVIGVIPLYPVGLLVRSLGE